MSSDPATPTVACVAEALGLPGPPLQAVVALTDKGRFRNLMHGIGLPTARCEVLDAEGAGDPAAIVERLAAIGPRRVVKPVDSAGSRGVTVLLPGGDVVAALRRALEHSRAGRCIVEDFIDGEQIEGDGFLQAGRLAHCHMGDQSFFTGAGNSVPVATCWPSR